MSVEAADLVASLRGEDIGFLAMMAGANTVMGRLHTSTLSATGAISNFALGLGALATGALVASIKEASDYNTLLTKVQDNTTLTNAQMGVMSAGILQMASRSNASLTELATGFMHITNLGFSARDSMTILQAAMESATSTGSDTSKVANVLALQMHDFGMGARDAGKAMDVLHLSAALGNATLEQFVDSTSKAVTTAANLHVPLVQVDAALAALSRHMPLAQASTALAGALSKIINPSKGASAELLRLQEATGVPLVSDFTAAGLASKGLTGVLADLSKATNGNASEMYKLIPATRGGMAAMVLTGTAAKDFRDVLVSLNDAMNGKVHPTHDAFARIQKTLSFETGVLSNNFKILAITMGQTLLPIAVHATQALIPLVQAMTHWAQSNPGLVHAILGTGAALGGMGIAMKAMGLLVRPLIAILGALDAPVLAIGVAVAALAVAWAKDWGGIREKTAEAWKAIRPMFDDLGKAFGVIAAGFNKGGITGAIAAFPQALHDLQRTLPHDFGIIYTFLQGAAGAIREQMGRWALAFTEWIGPATIKFLHDWPGMLNQFLDWIGNVAAPAIAAKLGEWAHAFVSWAGTDTGKKVLLGLAAIPAVILAFIAETAVTIGNKLIVWAAKFTGFLIGQWPAMSRQLGEWSVQLSNYITGPMWADLTKALDHLANAAAAWVKPGWDRLVGQLADLKRNLIGSFADAGSWLVEAGGKIMGGLIQGLKNHLGDLKDWLGSLKDKIVGWKGPPSVDAVLLQDNGALIMQGLIAGIQSGRGALQTALGALSSQIVTATSQVAARLTSLSPNTSGLGALTPALSGLLPAQVAAIAAALGTGAGAVPLRAGGNTVTAITVTVADGAVRVSGGDAPAGHAVGQAIADALQLLVTTQRTTAPGAPRLLPGALTPLAGAP